MNWRVVNKKVRIPDYLYILIFSILLAFLNISIFSKNFIDIITSITVQISLNILLLTIFSFNKSVLKIFSGILLLFTMLSLFCYHQYGIVIDEMVILSIFDNVDNFSAVNPALVTFYVVIFLLICCLIKKLKITNKNLSKKFVILICSIVIISIFLVKKNENFIKDFFSIYAPENVVVSVVQYTNKIIKNSRLEIKDLSQIYDFKNKNNNQINIVLVIGESARSDHFSLNNYSKNTNPLLSKTENLISFKNVTPCANATSYAVPCILSYQNRDEFVKTNYQYTNLISVFNKLGFATHWFSMQSAFGNQNLILKNALQAQYIKMKSSYRYLSHENNDLFLDEFLLPDLKNVINQSKNNFIILHTNGSHFPLDHFMPSSFTKFQPICTEKSPQNCDSKNIKNAYDNTILYTDFFLSSAIEILKNSNSIMFYVSDHGAFLGEEGKFFHGNKNDYKKKEHRVPMILWISDKMLTKTQYLNNFKNAKNKINDNLSHDNIFYSVLGCAGISHNIEDKKSLNICSK